MKMDWNVSVSWTIGGNFVVFDNEEDSPIITVSIHDVGVRRAMLEPDERREIADALAYSIANTPHPFESPPQHPEPDDEAGEE